MERNEGTASSSSADDAAELRELEERRKAIEARRAEREKAERGPADRDEAFVSGLVELVQGAAAHRPTNWLRERAAKMLEAIRGG